MDGFESPRARGERMRRERYAAFSYLVDNVPQSADGDGVARVMGAFALFCELQPEQERIEREPAERLSAEREHSPRVA